MKTEGTIKVLIFTDDDKYEHQRRAIKAVPVEVTPEGKIRNITDGPLDNLVCEGAVRRDQADWGIYGWSYQYEHSFVDLAKAKTMVKQLEAIERALAKMQKDNGNAETFGEFVVRFAKAIKADGFLCESKHNGGWSYDDNEHRMMDSQDARYHVRILAEEWLKDAKIAA